MGPDGARWEQRPKAGSLMLGYVLKAYNTLINNHLSLSTFGEHGVVAGGREGRRGSVGAYAIQV
jgi:hypothetical protein